MTNEEITFAELEHKGGQHPTFQEGCETCYKQDRLIKAHATVNDPFSFENVAKFMGEVNRINYGINPYEK